ncbi:hypothetical protein [Fodinicola feengrottensis]|uniref:hypothetical protein n=1 Tax=Fodinicola feengrottensis TaxID=435914 RepID=UPI00244124F4|nr:hypothetical protein [Fodinicola feengrottensis]
MAAVQESLGRWEKPALIAFSDSDPVFPYPKSGTVFTDLIPGAGEQVRIEGGARISSKKTKERKSPLTSWNGIHNSQTDH